MLTPYARSSFVERVVADACGRRFKALFFVALVDGEVRARLVSIQPVVGPDAPALPGSVSDGILCLAAATEERSVETPYSFLLSPYSFPVFDLESFLSTQPTRAPAFA